MVTPSRSPTYRFGDLVLEVAAYELRRSGRPVRLERRPMDLLILLVERHGQLVPRADIVERLWGAGVYVDIEMGINTAVRKLRRALEDSVATPRFLETVPGKGYRFIGRVEEVGESAPSAAKRVTIAILPFENLDGDRERDYLAAGLTEEAIAAVGQIDPAHLSVIGRTSVLVYQRAPKTIAEIGRELGVSHVLEGTVRSEADHLRIVSRLTRVADQVQVWSGAFDSAPRSILAFQRELASAIAEQVRLRLSPDRVEALARRQSGNPDAYDLYLRGRYYLNQLTFATSQRAVEHFQRATQLDPEYALAWAGLADAYATTPIHGDVPPQPARQRAGDAAKRALGAAPWLAEAYTSAGFIGFFLDWDWQAAEHSLRRAIELDGDYAIAHRTLGVLLAHEGRGEESAASLQRARVLEPLSPMSFALSAQAAFCAREHARAADFARQATVIDPEFWIAHLQLGQALEQLGETDRALAALQHAARLSGVNSKPLSAHAHVLARAGKEDEARATLQTLRGLARQRYVPPYALALVHAGLGEHDHALAHLEHAYEVGDVHLIFLPPDPRWDPLRGHPRFVALLQQCGFVMARSWHERLAAPPT
jgi:TolB-like protein/Tfp pilus assembly protein PilF